MCDVNIFRHEWDRGSDLSSGQSVKQAVHFLSLTRFV